MDRREWLVVGSFAIAAVIVAGIGSLDPAAVTHLANWLFGGLGHWQ